MRISFQIKRKHDNFNNSVQTFERYEAETVGVVDWRNESRLPAGGGDVGGGEGGADMDGFEDESSESTRLSTSRVSNSGAFCFAFGGF